MSDNPIIPNSSNKVLKLINLDISSLNYDNIFDALDDIVYVYHIQFHLNIIITECK